jgi:hypothetical protein
MKHYKATGLSLPIELLKEIDENRGDIPRSRYLLKMLDKIQIVEKEKSLKNKQDSLDRRIQSLQSSEPRSQ